jgi:hypothetical protein
MNDMDDFDDAVFLGRVRTWADERRIEDVAPSRLVDAVMDEVIVTPRRRSQLRPAWQGLAGYAALTAVVTVGVTLGILFAQTIGPQVGRSPAPVVTQPPTMSPSPSGSPGGEATPVPLTQLPDIGFGVTALAAAGDDVWAVDRSNRLVRLDPTSGAVVRSVALPRSAKALLVTADSIWAASLDGALMRIQRSDLAETDVRGLVGGALAEGSDGIWLGATDAVVRIDPVSLAVTLRVPVPGRGAELGIAALARNVWVATRTQSLRLDGVDGTVTARLQGDATSVVAIDGAVYASRGTEVVRIDPVAATITDYVGGIPGGGGIAASPGRVWAAGPPGGAVGEVVGIETSSPSIVSRSATASSVRAVAVSTDTIWVAADESATIYRFAIP